MGKGDRKTRKGKIAIRSYGNKRPKVAAKAAPVKPVVKPLVRPAAKKPAAPRKKT